MHYSSCSRGNIACRIARWAAAHLTPNELLLLGGQTKTGDVESGVACWKVKLERRSVSGHKSMDKVQIGAGKARKEEQDQARRRDSEA